jgi:DNA processing protein
MDPLTEPDELRAALALAEAGAVGAIRFRELVDRHGSARRVLERSDAIVAGGEVPPSVARALRAVRPVDGERLERLRSRGIRLVAYGGPGYPASLGHLYAPPPVLYLTGPGELPARRVVAVVGTRSSTSYGRRVTRDLAAGLAIAGCTVVSGMARGIDAAAHRAALDAGGATVGVLGTGLDHVYPRINRPLYGRMREAGLLASEFPPPEPARASYFPRRNRIIAALAQAVVVVQAGETSGALITLEQATDLGREIFAVPGPVGPAASVGVHGLLRDGVAPATSAADVLETMGWAGDGEDAAGRADEDGRKGPSRDRLAGLLGRDAPAGAAVCAALSEGPRDADDLAVEAGLDAATAAALLGRLELEGVVRGLPGGRYVLETVGSPANDAA